MRLGNEVTIDGVKFVRADTLPKALDTHEAHKIMVDAGILGLYYTALEANWANEQRDAPDGSARHADKTRGDLFIAICEWAKKNGADLYSQATSEGNAK